jgi:hypothetical protein
MSFTALELYWAKVGFLRGLKQKGGRLYRWRVTRHHGGRPMTCFPFSLRSRALPVVGIKEDRGTIKQRNVFYFELTALLMVYAALSVLL